MLNIVYAGTLPPHQGGSAISGALISRGLSDAGHKVRAIGPITPDTIPSGEAFARRHPAMQIARFEVPFFETAPDVPPPGDYRTLEGEGVRRALSAMIAEDRPDVLFIGRETFAWHVPPIARAHALPCVMRVAGATTIGLLHHTHAVDQAERLVQAFRATNLLITPARHLTDRVRRLGLDHVITIRNAVDTSLFVPQPKDGALLRALQIDEDAVVVMHVSNLKSLKRPMDVIASAEHTIRHDARLVYVIVGDGAGLVPMEHACQRLGLMDRFRFVGWVDYPEMPRFLNLADIVVLPSEAEAQARIYLETQACARVLLASDIPAAREVVVDDETGMLFRMGDVDDLSEKTLRAAAHPDLRAEIGRRAQERVQHHRLADVVTEYVAAFETVIDAHRTA